MIFLISLTLIVMPEPSALEHSLLVATDPPPINVGIQDQLLDLLEKAKSRNTTGLEF